MHKKELRFVIQDKGMNVVPFSVTQLGGEGGSPTTNEVHRKMKMFLRVMALVILPVSSTFPSVSEPNHSRPWYTSLVACILY